MKDRTCAVSGKVFKGDDADDYGRQTDDGWVCNEVLDQRQEQEDRPAFSDNDALNDDERALAEYGLPSETGFEFDLDFNDNIPPHIIELSKKYTKIDWRAARDS